MTLRTIAIAVAIGIAIGIVVQLIAPDSTLGYGAGVGATAGLLAGPPGRVDTLAFVPMIILAIIAGMLTSFLADAIGGSALVIGCIATAGIAMLLRQRAPESAPGS